MKKNKWLSYEQFEKINEKQWRDQDKVAKDYMAKYGLTKDEFAYIHRFFSPYRVPRGMTEAEVHILLAILGKYPLDGKEVKKTFVAIMSHTKFPCVGPIKTMTRHIFLTMIQRMVKNINRNIQNRNKKLK